MQAKHAAVLTLTIGLVLGAEEMAFAQAVKGPATIWRFLGIPQGVNKVTDALVNRRGNVPRLERKPPLKQIADPENLESDNPAIKAAAQVKRDEDLAKQKIKAIKYLAKIGCGCYDDKYDPGPKKALMESLDDCTEKVRYAAAKAIGRAAENKCDCCGQTCCCDEAMEAKLFDVAYGRSEDNCCWKESSDRVREAAKEALCLCCAANKDRGGVSQGMEGDTEVTPETTPNGDTPETTGGSDEGASPDDQPPADDAAPPTAYFYQRRSRKHSRTTREATPVKLRRGSENVELLPALDSNDDNRHTRLDRVKSTPVSATRGKQARSQPQGPVGLVEGTIIKLDARSGLVSLSLRSDEKLSAGTRIKVNHQYALELTCLGELEVVGHKGSLTMAKPVGSLTLGELSRGDEVVYYLDPADAEPSDEVVLLDSGDSQR